MIKLKLVFGKENERNIDIVKDEFLTDAIVRVLSGIPLEHEVHETFNVVVNGHIVPHELWDSTRLSESDVVSISPKIEGGKSGQLFKQLLIIGVTVAAMYFLGPAGANLTGFAYSAAMVGVSIGASLLMNALIPPPVPDLGLGGGGGREIDSSQMYAITGQSNQMRRLGTVPKVYGSHRMFPTVAATPYTELAVDPDTGETIQYFYSIFDFGLGTVDLADLKIGDTPLTTDSFEDFEYRLVDINKPSSGTDEFDDRLESAFDIYRTKRVFTALSQALSNGDETIQFSDDNTDLLPQEIICDFICPNGLFSYSSRGATGYRNVKLNIDFALVGTEDWHAYNDLNHVESHRSVGGTDITEQKIQFATDPVLNDEDYYSTYGFYYGSYNGGYNGGYNNIHNYYLKKKNTTEPQRKILLPDLEGTGYEVGQKVFYEKKFLGYIASVDNFVGDTTEITLDRDIQDYFPAYTRRSYRAHGGVPAGVTEPYDIKHVRISAQEISAAVVRSNKQSAVYASFRFTPRVAGQYKVRVRRVETFGDYETQKQDNITWVGLTTSYKTPPVTTDKRHTFMELRIRATNQLNGHIQNLSAVATAVHPVYDAETETWSRQFTNNPAWVFCDLLTGEVNKRPVTTERLHMESILEWAEYCDEVPTPPDGFEYLEPRFQCNFILDYQSTLQSVLNQVGSAAQASLNIIDGKYGVLVDRLKTTPVQIFTPRNSKEFSSSRFYGPRPHAVRVKYIDPQMNWEVQEAIAYDQGYDEENATEFDELTSFACTNYEQAWRFGRYMIAQNRLRQETISLTVDFENLICTRGDYVQITQDVMRVGGTPARVKDISGNIITTDDSLDINPDIAYGYVFRSATGEVFTSTCTPVSANEFDLDGELPAIGDLVIVGEVGRIVFDCIVRSISPNDDMSANISLIEKADEIFDYESSSELPDYNPQLSNTSRPDWYPPKAVTDLVATDNTWECNEAGNGYDYFIELVWNIPPGSVYEFFEVWVNDGTGYRKYDSVTEKKFRYDIEDQSRLDTEFGFKVVAVSASGKKLQLIEMPEVLVTPTSKTAAPSDVSTLNMSITNQVLQLSWDKLTDCDVSEYHIRFSPDSNDVWESSVPLVTVSKDVNSVSVQGRTGIYLIKAIDFAGNQSANAAAGITSIPNLFDLNVITYINDAEDDFDEGTLEQTELLGSSVILQQEVPGDEDSVVFYEEGYYVSNNLVDLDDVYTCRLQSNIRADGYKFGELMANWEELQEVEHLNSATTDDWDVQTEYRATETFAAMADWEELQLIDHLNYGAGLGFTDWRPVPTAGDATGRIFQFRVKLLSFFANVTPRLFDGLINVDMPDRIDSFENETSSAGEAMVITYDPVFKGPGTTPNVQISIDNAQSGDYWTFDYKTLEGFAIRFYDNTDTQVVRQFDVVAKGYGRRHTATI